MKARILTILALAAFAAVACKQEAPPPPSGHLPAPLPAPQALQPGAQAPGPVAPAAPIVVYASAEPQHGGLTQKVGDYMVELATGSEGKVDFYVQKYEGAVQSFDDVQLAVAALSKTATDEDGAPLSQHVVFFPKDGKLQGTVAGMEQGAYDFKVAVYELESGTVAEGKFENVVIDPLRTDMEPKHDGAVYVVEKTKMELVTEGSKLKVYLRDLADKPLETDDNTIEDVRLGVGEADEQVVELVRAGDHFEGDLQRQIPEDEEVKVIYAKLILGDEKFDHLRVHKIPVKTEKTRLRLTKTDAKKIDKPKAMKGTIGSMKVAAPPAKMGSKPTKTSKGPITKGKKAGSSSPSGKKTKTSKGPITKGKKVK